MSESVGYVVVTPMYDLCSRRLHHVGYSHIALEPSNFLTTLLTRDYLGKRFEPFDQRRTTHQRRGDTSTTVVILFVGGAR